MILFSLQQLPIVLPASYYILDEGQNFEQWNVRIVNVSKLKINERSILERDQSYESH